MKFLMGIAIGIVLGPVVEKRYGHIYVTPLKRLLERLEEGSK